MLLIIIILSFVFFSLGFIVTEKNASSLLSGYNTLSAAEKAKVDLSGLIRFFRRFHQIFGVLFLGLGLGLLYGFSETAAGVFLGIAPILAYLYFLKASAKFYHQTNQVTFWAGVIILVIVLVFVSTLFLVGFRENKLTIQNQIVEISGMYGETILIKDIKSIDLVDQLPAISFRSNGFSVGEIHKGHYKLKNGEEVKLILNINQAPFLRIQKMDGTVMYYSSKSLLMSNIHALLQKELLD